MPHPPLSPSPNPGPSREPGRGMLEIVGVFRSYKDCSYKDLTPPESGCVNAPTYQPANVSIYRHEGILNSVFKFRYSAFLLLRWL
jgi:hypothetical protein